MARGILRIYLGAAPGAGTTYAMLAEGRRRAERGADVLVGAVDTHGRSRTAALLDTLPALPEFSVGAVLARRPQLALVDDLARGGRWKQVDAIVAAGIDVVTTVHVSELESLHDVVERITGVASPESVPDAFVRSADQIELVDITPEALRRRMAHGNVYPPDRVDAALANYFRPGNLSALRHLALLWVADRVDESLRAYRSDRGIAVPWETAERIVVALSGAPGSEHVIRRAARIAARVHGELIGVHVAIGDDSPELDGQRALLAEVGGTYREVVGDDVPAALASFAAVNEATQLIVGATRRRRWEELWRRPVVARLQRALEGVDVVIVSPELDGVSRGVRLPAVAGRRPAVPRQRELWAWLLCVAGLPLLTALLVAFRQHFNLSTTLLLNLSLVLAVSALGGLRPGFLAALLGFGLSNWYLTPPYHTFSIASTDNIVALVVFITVGVVVSALVDRAAQRSREARRARAEAQALARSSGSIISAADPLPDLLDQLCALFQLDAATILDRRADGWVVDVAVGESPAAAPADGTSLPLDEHGDTQLVLTGRRLSADDLLVLRTLTDQLALGMEARRLRREAQTVDTLEQANALRTALLQAVSHDLRTPLASIKASVSGLLEHEVAFSPADRDALLATIDSSADRLDRVIGNLLDMSRLQAGAIDSVVRPTALEEVVAAALAGIPVAAERVQVDVPETVPLVRTDGALLERALANLVSNAVAWSPPGAAVRVEAAAVAGHAELRVIDRGPGIPAAQRDRVFQPFQRLGDLSADAGVGLGLAIAKGFIEATGGTLELDDTPGGGSTFTASLPLAVA